ncbi:SGNH/GDSL hydrolase family protein [Arcicella rosea]|uniref:Sialidase-1 n=1 Tax=Arcicella rosea TaxID=502909 RepID=A0A841EHS4_9BACT|nr:SGNH/GDSL hydrolase family protein [Arcicella rosea]MBB6002536.1 sialidase-1 [Arcicella rosea]
MYVKIIFLLLLTVIMSKGQSADNLSDIYPQNNKPLYKESILTWKSTKIGSYHIYISENLEELTHANIKSPSYRGVVKKPFYNTAALNLKKGVKYYWRIDTEINSQIMLGNVNSFINPISSSNYHTVRNGLRNSFLQFNTLKFGRVAFLGGSITYNGGWRDSVMKYLTKRFPKTTFEFINAGVPSMGSTPAAFRLEKDVLSKGKIDLLIEEAAVNDGTNGNNFSKVEQIRAMEGIVRHTKKTNPLVDIVFLYFVDPGKIDSYKKNVIPDVILNHDFVANTYQIPSINLAKEVTDRINIGEFDWKNDFINLHPSPFGQGVYARSIIDFLETTWGEGKLMNAKTMSPLLPAKIDSLCYESGYLVDIDHAELSEGWSINPAWKPKDDKGTREDYVNVPMLITETPEEILTFKFTGRAVGISTASGSDAGIILSSVDNGPWKPTDLFTNWSKSTHLPWYFTLYPDLAKGNHVLKLKMSSNKNSKSDGNVARIRYFYVSGSKDSE